MEFLNKIPRPVLIIGVFVLGIGFIVYNNRPHNLCDTQLEDFADVEKGYLFPMPLKKGGESAPIYDRALNSCREGMGSPGACLEYFKILNKVIRDLDPIGPNCGEFVEEIGVIRKALGEGMKVMVQIAWGEELPAKEARVSGRLDPSELALFCRLRANWQKFFPPETYENFKSNVIKDLSTKIFVDKDGTKVCSNCEIPPNVFELMGGRDEVLKHTIFSLNCGSYR